MADGEIAAAFRSLAGQAADAGRKIGDSFSAFIRKTADTADENADRTLSADEENARAAGKIQPKEPDAFAAKDPGGPGAGSGSGSGNRFDDMLNPKDDGEPAPKWSLTKSLGKAYEGEEKYNWVWPKSAVKYLDDTDRAKFKITVKDGKLYDAKGNLFDTSDASSLHSADDPRAIFVMDKDGTIYASKWQVRGYFHHSSFLAGGDVAGAGELKVSNGELKLISNASGHYLPTRDMTMQVAKELESRGVDTQGKLEFDPASQ